MEPVSSPMLVHEEAAWQEGFTLVAGIDEAGRGPLAGPVVAAAVLIPPDTLRGECNGLFRDLNDSKKLSAKRRDLFFELLTKHPEVSYAVGEVDPETIDAINILKATHQAMGTAAGQLTPQADCLLVDGLPVPGLPATSRAIVGGDGQSLLIAAASIIAKVTRDRVMDQLDEAYPGYGFARHRGYGTKEHMDALRRLGPTPCHRKSFRPVSQQQLDF